ncbi:MAG TPA: glycosyltransferase [Candidatus Thermoplasmatota archaeon]|nr:glycosyltransferase [Candidatus Thermoplasmatota archaeon]
MAAVSVVLVPPLTRRRLTGLVAAATLGPAKAAEVLVAGRAPPEAVVARVAGGLGPRALAEAATGDVVVTLPGDGRHDPRFIPALVEALRDGAAVAVASRYVADGRDDSPPARRLAARAVNVAATAFYPLGVADATSGFRAYSREALAFLRDAGEGPASNLRVLALARRRRLRVVEVPVVVRNPSADPMARETRGAVSNA